MTSEKHPLQLFVIRISLTKQYRRFSFVLNIMSTQSTLGSEYCPHDFIKTLAQNDCEGNNHSTAPGDSVVNILRMNPVNKIIFPMG